MAKRKRRGAIVVLAAVLLVVMVAMIAFAVDVGFITVARTELQGAADAAALAGVARLPEGEGTAFATAEDYVGRNVLAAEGPKTVSVAGQWNPKKRTFQAGLAPFDALQVKVDTRGQAMFFGKVLGADTFDAGASAVAVVRPRDIVLVLDFSGSMNSQKKIDQLKRSVTLFFDVLDDQGNQDRVGFARYSTFGELVVPLTSDFGRVDRRIQSTKATGWTNIYEGMKLARQELQKNSRTNATKMMVVMTDGHTNRPGNRPKDAVLDEARLADAAGIDLYTISFGRDADKSLMDDVAEIGNDVHFSVDGSVSECERELREVFLKIAMKRKVMLVQ